MNARLLIIEDDATLRVTLERFLGRAGYVVDVAADGELGLERARHVAHDVALIDLNLPGIDGLGVITRLREAGDDAVPVVMTAYPEVRSAVAALKAGAYDYINKPFDLQDLLGLIERAVEVRQLRHEVAWRRAQSTVQTQEALAGVSRPFAALLHQARQYAASGTGAVLIVGESGAGKEHLAREMHRVSPRRGGPWITLDCAASPAEGFEALLFGREATGSTQARKGLIELAEGGTLLLDEVGELASVLQPKLLRVIEGQTFRRLGGVHDVAANVRFIALAHPRLKHDVAAGRFRSDLYYRLSSGQLEIPPLRERQDDIAALTDHFLQLFARRLRRPVPLMPGDVRARLAAYSWPGNARELRNVAERLVILSDSGTVNLELLPPEIAALPITAVPVEDSASLTLAEVELRHIQRVLAACGGNKTRAAEVLGISRLTLRNRLQESGLGTTAR